MLDLFRFGRPIVFALDPERAHGLSVAALKTGLPLAACPADDPRLHVTLAGLDFPNPLGMAAGYDKNAEIPDALLRLGFGFAEVGTVTPLPQPGNARPRIFRLVADQAVINRFGFNSEGHDAARHRLQARSGRKGIVGVNIGANKDSADRVADYVAGVAAFSALASYLTVNVSSPNTPGLRSLQARASLQELVERTLAARAETTAPKTPIFLKIAPDLTEQEMDDVADIASSSGLDGLIVSNTTLARNGLKDRQQAEAGGMSGRPLFARSTAVLARMRIRLGRAFPLIGVGGVDSVDTALEKIRAGADLVQLYTGMIYAGPGLPGLIVRGMAAAVRDAGLASISELRDTRLDQWASASVDA